jgi:hypothetical protein
MAGGNRGKTGMGEESLESTPEAAHPRKRPILGVLAHWVVPPRAHELKLAGNTYVVIWTLMVLSQAQTIPAVPHVDC